MHSQDNCPNCQKSFQGSPIPDNIRHHYGDSTHWRLEIGIDGGRMGIYDGLVAYQCPFCSHEFARNSSEWALKLFKAYKAYQAKLSNCKHKGKRTVKMGGLICNKCREIVAYPDSPEYNKAVKALMADEIKDWGINE